MGRDNSLISPLLDEDTSSYSNSYNSSRLSQSDHLVLSGDDSIESLIDGTRGDPYNVDTTSICKNYFFGQISNVIKSSVWWSMFGVLIKNFSPSYFGLAYTRCVFNLSLIFGSFISNLIAEVVNIRKLLCITTAFRMLIWSIVIPISYTTSYLYNKMEVFWVIFLVLMLVDGFQISLSNTVDLDYEGIDRISHQYNILIPDSLHQYMNNVYQLVFDFSFVFVSIPVALSIFLLNHFLNLNENFTFIYIFNGTFFVLSMISLYYYLFGMPRIRSTQYLAYSRNLHLSLQSLFSEFFNKVRDVKDGLKIVYNRHFLFRNLLYFSFETAFENSMFLFIIPLICYNNVWFENLTVCGINLFCVCLISICKLGTSIYGIYVTYKIKNNVNHNLYISKKYTIIKCILLSSLSIALLPAIVLTNKYYNLKWLTLLMLVVSFFLFFAFTTLPKINYSSILQYNISNHPLSYKLFDFVGTFITVVDALMITGLSFVFRLPKEELTLDHVFLYTAGIYVAYTLIQVVVELIKPV